MIINGDWTLGAYKDKFGDEPGRGPHPDRSSTGTPPAPYTSGKFFMVPAGIG